MVDLTEIMNPISQVIATACLKDEAPRNYLGASIIGEPCDAKLWYDFTSPRKVDEPRLQRIFDLGNRIEDIIIEYFKKSGIQVWCRDASGNQLGFEDGIIKGHYDAVIMGIPESTQAHILEVKSAQDKRFKDFKEDGIRKTEIKYYAQVQCYMHYAELENALIVVYNKNDSELYFERIKYDMPYAIGIIQRGKDIAKATSKPERAYKTSTFFKCKMCNYRSECWEL